jgi:hypothetical protein
MDATLQSSPNAASWAYPPPYFQFGGDPTGYFFHAGLWDASVLRNAEKIEYARTAMLFFKGRLAWDDVHVDMAVVGVLGELGRVGLSAAGRRFDTPRHVADERSELTRLPVGQVGDGGGVAPQSENNPSFDGAVERVHNVPEGGP